MTTSCHRPLWCAVLLVLGLFGRPAAAGSDPSPVGQWQASINASGGKGVAILTVNADNTIEGYCVTSALTAMSTFTGTWSQVGRKISGSLSLDTGEDFDFTGSATFGKSLSIRGVGAVDSTLRFSLSGRPLPPLSDFSGTYSGSGRTGSYGFDASFTLTAGANPGSYDVTGTVVVANTDTYTFEGSAVIDGSGAVCAVVTEAGDGYCFNLRGRLTPGASGKFTATGKDLYSGYGASVKLTKN